MLPNKQTKLKPSILLIAAALCMTAVSYGDPMGTAFTYQGRLVDANSPAEGEYDMEFQLYKETPAGAFPLGSPIQKEDIEVADGYFTVQLDFGSFIFIGDAQWLQIGVRPGELEDPNTYSTLSPRQEITPTPYAMHSKNADTLNFYDSSAFASSGHPHDGSDITSGQVDEGHIDADITRDTELTTGLATKPMSVTPMTARTLPRAKSMRVISTPRLQETQN